jgi:hypothetical protein
MALYQSEMAKAEALRHSAAAALPKQKFSAMGQQSHVVSYDTLDAGANKVMSVSPGINSLEEKAGSSMNGGYRSGGQVNNNQTISELIKNLDLIKNINK